MNNKKFLILPILFLNLLVSCTNDSTEINQETSNTSDNIYNISNFTTTENIVKEDENTKELSIDNRCIGCGKCAIIAPNNFSMDFNTMKAVVISQKSVLSKEVETSIQVCPVDSIHLS